MTERKPVLEARQDLYEIIRRDEPFEKKAEAALDLGKQYLGADNGHLAYIDRETDHWKALFSTDAPDGRFPAGTELDLGTTYCRRTITEAAPIALHDASTQGWADDPAFETHGLHCYHGTTLILDGEPYGTICFVAETPRREQFSERETLFAELITRLLERELEREQHETALTRQTNLATVLNRVLRHNLRNDITIIRGYTQLMADEFSADTYSEPALTHIDNLLELSEKARDLDRVVATEFERDQIDIVALVESVVESVSTNYPGASFAIESDDAITSAVFPSLEQALTELIENAAKHAGESPTVTITIQPVPTGVEIRIADDGPGLADHEAAVLSTGTETPLAHGTGLGLWLAHWIVTSHDGSIDATVTADGTAMTITLPRSPTTTGASKVSELVRARDRYQAAFEEATDAMLILNDDAKILDANPSAARIFGLPRQELLGRELSEFIPEDIDFTAVWEGFKATDGDRDMVTLTGADGTRRRVEYTGKPNIVSGQHFVVGREVTR